MKKLIVLLVVALSFVSTVKGRELEGNWMLETMRHHGGKRNQIGLMNINSDGGFFIICENRELSILVAPSSKNKPLDDDNSSIRISYNVGASQTFISETDYASNTITLIRSPAKDLIMSIVKAVKAGNDVMNIYYKVVKRGTVRSKFDISGFADSFFTFMSVCTE